MNFFLTIWLQIWGWSGNQSLPIRKDGPTEGTLRVHGGAFSLYFGQDSCAEEVLCGTSNRCFVKWFLFVEPKQKNFLGLIVTSKFLYNWYKAGFFVFVIFEQLANFFLLERFCSFSAKVLRPDSQFWWDWRRIPDLVQDKSKRHWTRKTPLTFKLPFCSCQLLKRDPFRSCSFFYLPEKPTCQGTYLRIKPEFSHINSLVRAAGFLWIWVQCG